MHSRLDEVSSIHYGRSPSEVANSDGQIPIIGTGGEYGRASIPLFNAGVVVPRKGSLGNPQIALTPFWPTDTTFAVLPTENTDLRWLYYCLLSYDLSRLNEATGVPSISRDWLSKIEFRNPGYKRQKRIARILQTIDQTIEKTEALIDKYQQIKAGLMHDLFTRGIGPNGQLRPPREQAPELYQQTPIGWIPKNWEFDAIGRYVKSAQYGISTSLGDNPSGIPVLRMNNIQSSGFDVTDLKYSNDPEAYKIKLRAGDVLYNRTNSIDHVGKIAIWCNELEGCSFASYLVRLNLKADLMLPEYFSHWMTQVSSQDALRVYATPGVQQVNINPTNLQRVMIALPTSMEEQSKIACKINAVDCRAQREACLLKKLQEQKSGLMHDLLSGKVPVQPEVESETEAASA